MIEKQDIVSFAKIRSLQVGQSASLSSSSVDSSDSFQTIIKNLTTNIQTSSPPLSADSSMNQEQLMLLVRALQVQMNSRLYNTLFNQSLEANALAQRAVQMYGSQIAASLPEASNNSQPATKKNPDLSNHSINQIIQDASEKYDVDVDLIRSVIKTESNFNPSATSPKGAMGLMQLMPATAEELGVKNAYDARENVMGGVHYLKKLLERYQGNVDLALAAYNWGMGNVEKNPDRMPHETLAYIEKVRTNLKSTAS